jgi:hypothetical protein
MRSAAGLGQGPGSFVGSVPLSAPPDPTGQRRVTIGGFRSVLVAIPAPKLAGSQVDTIAECGEATAVNAEMKEGTI